MSNVQLWRTMIIAHDHNLTLRVQHIVVCVWSTCTSHTSCYPYRIYVSRAWTFWTFWTLSLSPSCRTFSIVSKQSRIYEMSYWLSMRHKSVDRITPAPCFPCQEKGEKSENWSRQLARERWKWVKPLFDLTRGGWARQTRSGGFISDGANIREGKLRREEAGALVTTNVANI